MRPHNIVPGDLVLLPQKKSKTQPQYDPDPYTVTKVMGTQITATRGQKSRTRDAQKFKKVVRKQKRNYKSQRQQKIPEEETGIDLLNPIGVPPTTPPVEPLTSHNHTTPPAVNEVVLASRYPNGYFIADPSLDRHQRQRQQPERFTPS